MTTELETSIQDAKSCLQFYFQSALRWMMTKEACGERRFNCDAGGCSCDVDSRLGINVCKFCKYFVVQGVFHTHNNTNVRYLYLNISVIKRYSMWLGVAF